MIITGLISQSHFVSSDLSLLAMDIEMPALPR